MLSERGGHTELELFLALYSARCRTPLGDKEIRGCLGLVGWEEWGVAANGYNGSLGMMKVFQNCIVVTAAQL